MGLSYEEFNKKYGYTESGKSSNNKGAGNTALNSNSTNTSKNGGKLGYDDFMVKYGYKESQKQANAPAKIKSTAWNPSYKADNPLTTQYNNTVGKVSKVQSWLNNINTKLNGKTEDKTVTEQGKTANKLYSQEKKALADAQLAAAYDVTDGMSSAKALKAQEKKTAEAGVNANTQKNTDKGNYYSSILNNKDLMQKGIEGSNKYNANADVVGKNENPGNKIEWAKAHKDDLAEITHAKNRGDVFDEYRGLNYVTTEENAIYNYLLATEGEKSADAFLDYIRPTLNSRVGQEVASNIAQKGAVGRYGNELLLSAVSGLEGGVTSIAQNLSEEAKPYTANEMANMYVGEDINKRHEAKGNADFNLEKLTVDAVNTIANMVPAITVGTLTGGAGGSIVGGLSARGATYRQLLNEGYTAEQADSVATIVGVAEGVTQYLLSGVSAIGGKVTGLSAEKLTGKIASPIARAVAELGIDATGETIEEILQNKIQAVAENSYLGTNNSLAPNSEDLYTAAISALTTVILQTPAAIRNAKYNPTVIGKSIRLNNMADSLIEVAKTSSDADTRTLATNLENGNVKMTDEQIGKLANDVEAQGFNLAMLENTENRNTRIGTEQAINNANANINNAEYTKAAQDILNNPNALKSFEAQYGKVEGTSKTEQVKNLSAMLYSISQNAQQTENVDTTPQAPTVPQTIDGAEHPMAQPTIAPKETNNVGTGIGDVMTIREMLSSGLSYADANKIISDPQLRATFEDMSKISLEGMSRGKAKDVIVEYGKGKQTTAQPITYAEPTVEAVPTTYTVRKIVKGENLTPEQSYVRGLIMNGEPREIITNPTYRTAFEELTGEKLSGVYSLAEKQILQLQEDLFSGETRTINNALKANGTIVEEERNISDRATESNPRKYGSHADDTKNYPKTHNKLNPLTQSSDGTHEQTPYIGKHSTAEEVAPNPLTQKAKPKKKNGTDTYKLRNTENGTKTAVGEQNNSTQQITQPTTENATQVVEPRVSTNPLTTNATTSTNNTAATQNGTNIDWGTDTAKTKEGLFDSLFTEEERKQFGDAEHIVHHDATIEAEVDRMMQNPEQVKDVLTNRPIDADGKIIPYADYEVALSNRYLTDLILQRTEAVKNNASAEEIANLDNQIQEIRKARNENATATGQALRQYGQFGGSSADIVSDTIEQLKGPDANLRKGMTEEQVNDIIGTVTEFADRLENTDATNTADIIQLIHDVSEARRTTGLFSDTDSKLVDDILHKVAEFDPEFLKNLATTQIRSIAGDYQKVGGITALKAVRFLWALSNPKTTITNVGANTAFGEAIALSSNNCGTIFDAVYSLFTGKREVAWDKGLLSKDTWEGATEATMKSFLEVTLDAEADKAKYAYNEIKGSTFKMTGNWFERFLATVSKYEGYALKTTDQMAKGGIEAETTRGLNALKGENKQNTETAKTEAEYRTLQSNGPVSEITLGVKNLFNKYVHIGNAKTGTYGIGDHFLMFAQVPANQVATQLEMQPMVSGVIALGNLGKMISEGQHGGVTSETQRKAAISAGKAVNGAILVGASAVLSAFGCIRCVDDEDDDVAAMLKAMGKNGTQWNIDATMRLVFGGDSKPQEGDTWISMNWIPQLNSMMITGNAMYQSYKDDGTLTFGEMFLATKDGLIDSLKDFPAVSGISSTVKSIKNGKYRGDDRGDLDENTLAMLDAKEKAKSVLGNEVGNLVSGITVPNALRAVASGTDDTERNLYSSNNPFVRAWDYIKAGIPGLRQTLAPKLDGFSNEVKNEGGLTQFLNKTLLPGAISHDRGTEIQKFTENIYNTTQNAKVVPDKSAPSSISFTKNGEKQTYTLSALESTKWQKTYGGLCEKMYNEAMGSTIFKSLSEEEQGNILAELNATAKGLANAEFLGGKTNNYTNDAVKLALGDESSGQLALGDKVGEYLIYNSAYKSAIENGNYKALDKYTSQFNSLDKNIKETLFEKNSDLRGIVNASDYGIGSKDYYAYKDMLKTASSNLHMSNTNSISKLTAIANANVDEETMQSMIDNNVFGLSATALATVNVFSNYGLTPKEAAEFLYTTDYTVTSKNKNNDIVETGMDSTDADIRQFAKAIDNEQIEASDENMQMLYDMIFAYDASKAMGISGGKSNGTLQNTEVGKALENSSNPTIYNNRNAIYNALREELSNYYNDWKNYSQKSEADWALKQESKGTFVGREVPTEGRWLFELGQ